MAKKRKKLFSKYQIKLIKYNLSKNEYKKTTLLDKNFNLCNIQQNVKSICDNNRHYLDANSELVMSKNDIY